MRPVRARSKWSLPLLLLLAALWFIQPSASAQTPSDLDKIDKADYEPDSVLAQLKPGAPVVLPYGVTWKYVEGHTDWIEITQTGREVAALKTDTEQTGSFLHVQPNYRARIPEGPELAIQLPLNVPLPEIGEAWTDDPAALNFDASPFYTSPFYAPNDPLLGVQWALPKIGSLSANDQSRGAGVIVAVVDTGVRLDHPDLASRLVGPGRDFVSGHADANDDHGHGTHVAGSIGAATGNGTGIAAVAPEARILPVKVLAASGNGSYAAIASGIRYAADNGARVINMSLGGPCAGDQILPQAIQYATSKGVVVIAAAGNSNTGQAQCPASLPGVIGVSATDPNDQKASFSNFGVNAKIAAPGTAIRSTVPTSGGQMSHPSGYNDAQGTSMAAPHVAGVAALVIAANPAFSVQQVTDRLLQTADNIGQPSLGAGRVNALRAVGSAPAPTPGPSPTPPAGPLPSPTPPSGPSCSGGDYEAQIVCLINQARQQAGLAPYRVDSRLGDAADFHNRWMRDNNCFSHNCPGEPPVMSRMRNAGYEPLTGGENIGKGYTTPQAMMTGWMNSSGHRAAILSTYWVDLGCGYLLGHSGQPWDSYWSCEFAKPVGYVPTPATPAPTRTAPPPSPTRPPAPLPTLPPVQPLPMLAFQLAIPIRTQPVLDAAAEFCQEEYNTVYRNAGPGCLFLDINGRMTPNNAPPPTPTGSVHLWGYYFTTLHQARVETLERLSGIGAIHACPFGGSYRVDPTSGRRHC